MIQNIAKNDQGEYGLGRVLTLVTAIALTFGFMKEAMVNGLEWKDYPAYAIAMLFSYGTAKAVELINAIKGQSSTSSFTQTTRTTDGSSEVK